MKRALAGALVWLLACGDGSDEATGTGDAGPSQNVGEDAGAMSHGSAPDAGKTPGVGGSEAGVGDAASAQGAHIFDFSVAQIVAAATPDAIDRETAAPRPNSGAQGAFAVSRQALTADTLMSRFTDQVYTMMTGFTMKAIMTAFDGRLDDINRRAASFAPACLTSSVAASALVMPDGSSVELYAQCHDGFMAASDNFVIFGRAPDGAFTVFERSPAGAAFVHAAPSGSDPGSYAIDAYFSVFPQADGSGSALIVHVQADSQLGTVKWTGAYNTAVCGVTYAADAVHVYLRGSANDVDQGGNACAAELSAVYNAADLSVDTTTTFDEARVFSGSTFIRRVQSSLPAVGGGPGMDTIEAYPGGGNVLLTRAKTAEADLTDLNFGPNVVDALGSMPFGP